MYIFTSYIRPRIVNLFTSNCHTVIYLVVHRTHVRLPVVVHCICVVVHSTHVTVHSTPVIVHSTHVELLQYSLIV